MNILIVFKNSHAHSHSHSHSEPHKEAIHSGHDANTIWRDTIGAVIGISVAPFALLVLVPDLNKHHQFLKILLAFAAGGLLGDAFLHLIPHALSHRGDNHHDGHDSHGHSHSFNDSTTGVFLSVIGGIFVFLCIDKVLRFLRGGHDHSHAAPQNHENSEKKAKNGKTNDKSANSTKVKAKRTKGS